MPSLLEQGVSLLVPVFNEAEGLPMFLQELRQFEELSPYPLEIVIVDDGSSDDTPQLLKSAAYRVVRHETNLGYGAAIKTGIDESTRQAILILDADGTYRFDDVLNILRPLENVDMVVGARLGPDAQIPWVRRPAKWIVKHFASWMVRRSIPDLNSGLRAFRRDSVEKIKRLLPDGFSLTTTMTIAFLAGGRRVIYHPIQYHKRSGRSKFRPISDTWNMILLILRTVVLFRPLNVFLPLSFTLAMSAFAVLIVSKIMGRFMDATFIVLMMTSIQMFVLGLIADLIVRMNLWTH